MFTAQGLPCVTSTLIAVIAASGGTTLVAEVLVIHCSEERLDSSPVHVHEESAGDWRGKKDEGRGGVPPGTQV
jgi:hypothetical protein